MFPYEDLVLENGLTDKPVLLSYRSQQMLLMALSKMEVRHGWLEMDDATWDELEDYIAQCETEILTITDYVPMSGISDAVQRQTALNIAANTPTAITWTIGGYDLSNPTRFDINFNGYIALTGRIQLTSVTAGTKTVLLRRNGTDNLCRVQLPVSGQFFSFSLAWADYVVDGDYLEMIVQCSTASSIVLTEFDPAMSYIGYVQP